MHNVSISLQKHGSPYTGYGLSGQVFDLITSWQSYSEEFTTSGFTGTVNDGRLMFWLAPYDAAGDHYYIDDVALEKAVSTAFKLPDTGQTKCYQSVSPHAEIPVCAD